MTLGRIVCAISGGVDSAVAALLLKRKGFNVVGVFMNNWDLTDEFGTCSVDEDRHYAQKVCSALKIPFHEVNLVKEYWVNVFEPMVEKFSRGVTPNPDVLCNRHVKFDAFHKKCQSLTGDSNIVIATGHYAHNSLGDSIFNNDECTEAPKLIKAVDEMKDQTFFLHQITSHSLAKTYFPLGMVYKSEVKCIASESEVSFTLDRKESMGICFIGKRSFKEFISNYIPPKPGHFLDFSSGKVLGKHDGIFLYTDGQRSKIAGQSASYVVLHRDVTTNNVLLVQGVNHPVLYNRSMITSKLHWVSPGSMAQQTTFNCQFRLHHRTPLVNCEVNVLDDDRCLIILEHPLRACTPGQNAVLYKDEECLGGAEILEMGPSLHECVNPENIEYLHFRNAELWRPLMDKFGSRVGAFHGKDTIELIQDYYTKEKRFRHLGIR